MVNVGDDGKEYFTFNATTIKEVFRPENVTGAKDVCTFLSETIQINRKATGIFSTDLTATSDDTSRDDLILAFLSLALLLVIEGILTSVLLRTYNGRTSNFSFSIRQFIDLAREFRLRRLIRSHQKASPQSQSPRRINVKLLIIATMILSFTFGLEVLVLFLSTPQDVPVTNRVVSFTLVEAVIPDWNEVRRNILLSSNRPCTAVTFSGVEQRENQLSACMASTLLSTSAQLFPVAKDKIDVTIQSNAHEFGAEHYLTIDGLPATFVARAYFALGDGKNRIMRKRASYFNKERAMGLVHKQFIAYLFNYYNLQRPGDAQMSLQRLKDLDFSFSTTNGPAVSIMQVRGKKRFRQVISTTHMTKVSGVIPSGPEALRFAQAVLKGSTAISLAGPDENDLEMGSGNTSSRLAVMWYETARTLNWLSLFVVFMIALAMYAFLRVLLKPIGTAEIAGFFVTEAVGADWDRPPAMLADDEKKYFEMPNPESWLQATPDLPDGNHDGRKSFSTSQLPSELSMSSSEGLRL